MRVNEDDFPSICTKRTRSLYCIVIIIASLKLCYMREYFEAEMRLLRDAAQEFAEKYPEQASMLNLHALQDRDPYIERLLEGIAFLTAQIRQKIDDDVPEISESLLLQLWPHLLRPFPSMTVVQFNARLGQLQQTYEITKGTLLQSQMVGEKDNKQVCKFRTCYSVNVNPLHINDVCITDSKTGGSLVKLQFQVDAGITADSLNLSDLRLYLHADSALALILYFALVGQTEQVEVSFPEYPISPNIILGNQECICPSNFSVEDCLSPKTGRSFYGFHLLHEYFLFREKYFFITLQGLQDLKWPDHCQQFTVIIHSKSLLQKNYQINKETFRLHCTPAINLFDTASEPIELTHRKYEYPIVVNADDLDANMLYSVDSVHGTTKANGQRNIYHPMYSFRHKKDSGRYYHVVRHDGHGYLTINSNEDFSSENLSCAITACNGYYPRRYLQENQINIPVSGFPDYIQFKNITRPTPMYIFPRQKDYRWILVSHLSLNYSSLADLKTLQQLLNNYDWSCRQENQKRILGIHAVDVETVDKIHKGALTQGVKFTLKIHENNFTSLADIYLFGLVLHHFFSMYASINFFVVTSIICDPSNKEFLWQPLHGANFLI